MATDLKFFPLYGLNLGVGLGVDNRVTESFMKALAKEQLVLSLLA